MQNNQQNKNKKDKDKEIILQKILGDRFSNKLITRITIAVIIILVILRIILYFGMPPYYVHEHSDHSCTNDFKQEPGLVCEVIDIQQTEFWTSNIDDISKEDMFVVVQGIGMRNSNNVDYEVFDMEYHYNYYELRKNKDGNKHHHGLSKAFENSEKRKIEIYCPKNEQICRFNDYIFITDLSQRNIQLEIQLSIPEDKKQQFKSFQFTIWKGNKKVGKILMGFQYTFFCISLIMAIVYILNYCKISKENRSFENVSILLLSISLVLFNNPFYALSLYHSNKFFQILGTLFVCLFIILAFHFWIVVGRRIEHKEYKPYTIHADLRLKVALFLTFLLLALPSCVYNTSDELHPAFYGHGAISMLLLIALIFAIITTGGFWIYIMILFCQNLSNKKFVPQRYRNLLFVSVLFFVYLLFNFLTGFYHYNPSLPGRNIIYLMTVNFYVYYLQIIWRKQDGQIKITDKDEQPGDNEQSNYEKDQNIPQQNELVVRDFDRSSNDTYEKADVEQDHFNLDKLGLEDDKVDQNETGEIYEQTRNPTNLRKSKLEEEQEQYNKRQSYEFKY